MRDRRHLAGAEAIFSELCAHIAEATNSGTIRPTMTVFAPSTARLPGPRIENRQLAGYAGYRDGAQILGDPKNLSFTERALAMGWTPPSTKTPFDLLPWIITGAGEEPRLFPLPPGLIREVHLTHPTLAWFGDLGLRWYALPTISDHRLIAASTEFSAAPFSGWFMGTEIGARDLGDEARYNRLPAIAHQLGLDLSSPQSLWRDRALLELNVAVLHSYAAAGVTLVDHHTASAQFMRFATQEESAGRPLSAQWDWIVPPMSGSTTPVFHLPMTDRHLLPNFFPPASPA
jgi:nitric-oxide synthase